MPRGCVITITVFSAFVLAASVLFYLFIWPDRQRQGTSASIYHIEGAMRAYRDDFGRIPAGVNREILAALFGENAREKSYLTTKSVPVHDGQFVDFWKRPLRFLPPADAENAEPNVVSAGPNGELGDADDITSQLVRDIFRAKNPPPAEAE